MKSKILHIREGEYGLIAIMDLADPIAEHAHSGTHLQFWLDGATSNLRVGKHIIPRNREQAIAINSYEPHSTIDGEESGNSLCILFNLNKEWVTYQYMRLGVSPKFKHPSIPVNNHLHHYIQNFAHQLINDTKEWNVNLCVSHIFDNAVLAIKDRFDNETFIRAQEHIFTDIRIQKSIIFMQKNLDARFNFAHVAKTSGLSRAQFFNLFQKNMHLKPTIFWNTIRMEVAIDKIIRTKTSLTDLSYVSA